MPNLLGLMIRILVVVATLVLPPAVPPGGTAGYVVSYEGAAWRLAALDPLEAQEQVRDWARIGLAASLGLDRTQVVDDLYDTAPVRDAAFAEIVEQEIGPGRALFDGTVLHLLVPDGDPQRARTVGSLLDQHRVDAGADAVETQIHRYRDRTGSVELFAEPVTPTAQVRAVHGWTEARVDRDDGLATFLAAGASLSRLERRGAELWALGWSGRGAAGVTAEDLSVLQRGYRSPDGGSFPGFSLDPGAVAGVEDVRAALPDLDPALAPRVLSGDWTGSGFASAAEVLDVANGALYFEEPPAATLPARGLPADRTQLWALVQLMSGAPAYSQARYDGGLAGTEVGMTLFYTDLVAKDWTSGVGTGVPEGAVAGFVPDPRAVIPPSLCPPEGSPGESGRLWFGQNDGGFAFGDTAVDIGAQATRLFSRADGPAGTEIEPSYGFGRGLRWWDQHYQAVADHEPQYQRLEELMRWSGALEWLAVTSGPRLPQLPDSAIRSDLTFATWYDQHDELRERAQPAIVTPPSATGEAVLAVPSAPAPSCYGLTRVQGGVSLADRTARTGALPTPATGVPVPMRRADLDPGSRFEPGTGVGELRVGEVVRTLRDDGPVTRIDSEGAARATVPFGEARLRGDAERRVTQDVSGGPRDLTFDMRVQDQSFGALDATADAGGARLTLRRGIVERLQSIVDRLRDPAARLSEEPAFRYEYPTADGVRVRFDEGWIDLPRTPTGQPGAVAFTRLDGTVGEARPVTPGRLDDPDLAALVAVDGPGVVGTVREVTAGLPPDTPIYRGDSAGLVAGDPAAVPPELIRPPADQLVRLREARPVDGPTGGAPAGSVPLTAEGRMWNLLPPPDPGGAGGGSPGPGVDTGPVPPVYLLTLCPDGDPVDDDCAQR